LPDFSRRNVPKLGKVYQIATKLPNGRIKFKMAKEYTSLFPKKKALENLPKFGFLV
jgi:hypothetical protein